MSDQLIAVFKHEPAAEVFRAFECGELIVFPELSGTYRVTDISMVLTAGEEPRWEILREATG